MHDHHKRTVKVKEVFRDLAAFTLHNKFYEISPQEAEDILVQGTVGVNELLQKHSFDFPKNLGRVVKPELSTKTSVTYYHPVLKTTAGRGIAVPKEGFISFLTKFNPKKYEQSGLKIGEIFQRKVRSVIKNKKMLSQKTKLEMSVSSPWVDYERKIEQKGSDIVVIQNIKVKKQVIKHEELKSKELAKLQKELRIEAEDLILVFA